MGVVPGRGRNIRGDSHCGTTKSFENAKEFSHRERKMDFEKVLGSGSAGSVAILALANFRFQRGLKNDVGNQAIPPVYQPNDKGIFK